MPNDVVALLLLVIAAVAFLRWNSRGTRFWM